MKSCFLKRLMVALMHMAGATAYAWTTATTTSKTSAALHLERPSSRTIIWYRYHTFPTQVTFRSSSKRREIVAVHLSIVVHLSTEGTENGREILLSSPTILETDGIRADSSEIKNGHNDQNGENVSTNLLPGTTKDFFVVHQWQLSRTNFSLEPLLAENGDGAERLGWTPSNITLPAALMLLEPETYPTLSRARKACRKGTIVHLVPRLSRESLQNDQDESTTSLTSENFLVKRGFVGDRVFPGDIIGKQVRVGSGYFHALMQNHAQNPPSYELPTVVYEDDHMAIINKPPGMVVYGPRKINKKSKSSSSSTKGDPTVRAALPFILTPPRPGTLGVLRRPMAVHRIDKPTSGILVIAKTQQARLELSQQFRYRKVQKTYTAIVHGRPDDQSIEEDNAPNSAFRIHQRKISIREAKEIGYVDLNNVLDGDDDTTWNLIDMPLDNKPSVTIWRKLEQVESLHAQDGYLALLELKPKTGRHHQLRRHLSWVCGCPIVGDSKYDLGTEAAMKFRSRGLFLSATRIRIPHPFYRVASSGFPDATYSFLEQKENLLKTMAENNDANTNIAELTVEDDIVHVECQIPVPNKFSSMLQHERHRFNKFMSESVQSSE